MSTVIRDNGDMMKTLHLYNKNTTSLQKNMSKITSGLRIAGAGDDPSTFAVSERMREQVRSIDQANMNVQNDTSLIKVAEAAIATTIEVIQTLKARAVNSASDHNTEADRAIIQREVTNLLEAIDGNSQVATFNGIRLLDGSQSAEGLNFHIGGEVNFSVNLKLDDMSAKGLGLDALDLSTREGAQKALGVDDGTGKYVNYKTVTDADGNTTKIFGLLDTALNKALEEQTKLGAMEERLGFTRENLNSISENTQSAISQLVDVDYAKEMTSYVKFNILSQATEYMLSQMNQNAMKTLDLLAPVQ